MVAEEQDAARVVHRLVLAKIVLVEDRRHRGDVFVTEAQVGAGETRVAGLYGLDPNMVCAIEHMPRENFLRDGHRARLGFDGRQKDLTLQPRDIEGKQTAVLDDLTCDFVFTSRELS